MCRRTQTERCLAIQAVIFNQHPAVFSGDFLMAISSLSQLLATEYAPSTSTGEMLELRNRSALAVICCVIIQFGGQL